MKIDVGRLRRPMTWYGLPLAVWTLYWASVIWTDVRAETAIGQGEALRDVAAHEVFQLLFVAAHGGVRWMSGVIAILAVGLAVYVWRRREHGERREDGERTGSRIRPIPVSGD